MTDITATLAKLDRLRAQPNSHFVVTTYTVGGEQRSRQLGCKSAAAAASHAARERGKIGLALRERGTELPVEVLAVAIIPAAEMKASN